MKVTANTNERSTETPRVRQSAEKKSPTTPFRSPSGRKTTRVVAVEPTTAPSNSRVPSSAACGGVSPSPRGRQMVSMTNTGATDSTATDKAQPPRGTKLTVAANTLAPKKVSQT